MDIKLLTQYSLFAAFMEFGVCGWVNAASQQQHTVQDDRLVSVSFIEQCDVGHGPVSFHAPLFIILRWQEEETIVCG